LRVTKYLAFVCLSLLTSTPIFAQAPRTWVSGVGDDVNPCSRTAPCKTFAGAFAKTAAGGEINALDPAGYGAVTINKAITIDGGGMLASILASSSNGVIINAGINDVVTLRNLSINGVRQTVNPGSNGVRVLQAANVHIEHCAIFGFSSRGIDIQTSANVGVFVRNTVLRNNGEGIGSVPSGAAVVRLSIEDSTVDQSLGQGLNVTYSTALTAAGSHFNNNGASGLIIWGSTSTASLDRCDLNGNQYGIYAGYMGGVPQIRVSHCLITGNTISGIFLNGGVVTGFQNNVIVGNSGNNFVSMSVAQQ
jgi:parallel beta helix pectate lyase-like protein